MTGISNSPTTVINATGDIVLNVSPFMQAATISAGATLELTGADTGSVTFEGSTGMLKLDVPSTFSGEIFNFAGNGTLSGSDQIDLTNINHSSVHDSYTNSVLTVTDGTDTDELDFNGSYVLANFKFASDGNGGTIVYDPPASTANAATPREGGNNMPANELQFSAMAGNGAYAPGGSDANWTLNSGSDTFVFAPSLGQATDTNYAARMATTEFDHAEFGTAPAAAYGSGQIDLPGVNFDTVNDNFAFAPNLGHAIVPNYAATRDATQFDHAEFGAGTAAPFAAQDIGHANGALADSPHDTNILPNLAAVQLHHSDFLIK